MLHTKQMAYSCFTTSTSSQTVILDSGSRFITLGFAGDFCPKVNVQSVVGRPKIPCNSLFKDYKYDILFGDQAVAKRGICRMRYPIEHRYVSDWDDFGKLHNHCFKNELKIAPKEHGLIASEFPMTTRQQREKMCEMVFEEYEFQKYYVQCSAQLALLSQGLTTGVAVDIGWHVSHIDPVYQGLCLQYAIPRVDIGGEDLTDWMRVCLQESGYCFTTTAEWDLVRQMKEQLCCVSEDYELEIKNPNKNKQDYELPDETIIPITFQRFKCPELLFKPDLYKPDLPPIQDLLQRAIFNCDHEIQSQLYQSIVTLGGTSMIPNFGLRLEKEMLKLVQKGQKVRINEPNDRKYLKFLGGSVLGCVINEEQYIKREEYEEMGPIVACRKCM